MRLILLLAFTAFVAVAQSTAPYQPPTQTHRLKWATFSTIGAPNLIGGVFTSAISTAQNRPPEYGTQWAGYGKRQALRLSGSATSNLMEAELGALWGEDPRYRRATTKGVKSRLWHALKTSVQAYDREGRAMPTYGRFIAIPASNILANTWRPDSQHSVGETTTRISPGFVSRITSNMFAEFFPDLRRHFSHK